MAVGFNQKAEKGRGGPLTRCVAVGHDLYQYVADSPHDSSTNALAETWNGKAWTIAKRPALHAGRSDVLNAVSCPSATKCVAVGQYEPNKTQIGIGWAGIWNGETWKQAMV